MPIVVIGAGAAGMMAAIAAVQRGRSPVILLEKNRKTGVKILMSGGTRCNLTHRTDARGITSAFGHADRFLQPSVGAFDPDKVVDTFDRWGVSTKVESTGKVFPESNSAVDVRDALLGAVRSSGVDVRVQASVCGLTVIDDNQGRRWQIDVQEGPSIQAAAVIVTSGGRSWPKCGTTGDGYGWLRQLGHHIVPTRPALVPLVGGRPWMHQLSGLTLEDVIATVRHVGGDAKTIRRLTRANVGDGLAKLPKGVLTRRRSSWLWTHFGFSGPAAMDVSGVMTAAESSAKVEMTLDLLPDRRDDEINRTLCQTKGPSRLSGRLSQWLPNRLAAAITNEVGGDVDLSQLTSQRRVAVVTALKALPIPVNGTRGFAKAEVTGGGVDLSEVDRRTMKSRRHDGLYIAGEVLDVDGPIGGYNFQAAFATGRLAGYSAAQFVVDQQSSAKNVTD